MEYYMQVFEVLESEDFWASLETKINEEAEEEPFF